MCTMIDSALSQLYDSRIGAHLHLLALSWQ